MVGTVCVKGGLVVVVVIKLVEIRAICGCGISRSSPRRTSARRGSSIGGGGCWVLSTWNHKPRGGSSSMHLSNWGNMLRVCMCVVGVLKLVLLVNLMCLVCLVCLVCLGQCLAVQWGISSHDRCSSLLQHI